MIREHGKYTIESFDSVDSTNDRLKAMAMEGLPEFNVITADEQRNGKGRKGRSFFSKGNKCIYMSILLRPKLSIADSLLVTTSAAVAVCSGIKKITGRDAKIKWVNDIFLNERKICGILAEAFLKNDSNNNTSIDYIVLGIGINVFFLNKLPDELINVAGSVYSETESLGFTEESMELIRSDIIDAVLDSFYDIYSKLPDRNYMKEYRRECFCIGKEADYYEGGMLSGHIRILDIDDDGRLIALRDGKKIVLDSGEVSIKIGGSTCEDKKASL